MEQVSHSLHASIIIKIYTQTKLVCTVGASKLLINDTEVCPGRIIMFECTVNGSLGDSTVWQGTALSDCEDNNEITLPHIRFENGTLRQCKNGSITGRSMRVDDYNTSSNYSLYVSQLVIVVQPEMIGKSIKCVHDDISEPTVKIGNISLLSPVTLDLCNVSNNNMGSKQTKLPILLVISVSAVPLFILLLSAMLIFLLFKLHKKLWSTLNSV